MKSFQSLHSLHLGVRIFTLAGLGSSINGGSSWITCGLKFKSLKTCKQYIDSLEGSSFEWILKKEQEAALKIS